jgi:cyclophilin family peptidyl-prolyl cis-trans isomerase/protein-disulfide isomerase
MRLRILFILVFTFLLSACAAQTEQAVSTVAPSQTTVSTMAPTSAGPSCSTINLEPTPIAAASLVPLPTGEDYTVGKVDAPVTMMEYCDFQSASCLQMASIISFLVTNHPDDLRFVFRPIPLADSLDKSALAIQAATAADGQGKFWEMYNLLFQKNSLWVNISSEEFKVWIADQAAELGLDVDKFIETMYSPETEAKVKSMGDAAVQSQVQKVPLLLINGKPYMSTALNYRDLEYTISMTALGARQFTECPPFTVDPAKQYTATLETAKGNIVIQLLPDKAPHAVNSFIFLARQGWFDSVTFHRVIPGFVAQAGDPSGTGSGNPGYFFKNESDPSLKYDRPGMVGMANSGPDTNGSQFFITYAPAPHLDGKYTIFGQVLSGMDVMEKLTPRDPTKGDFAPGDILLHVTIEEK